jgi:peptide-methionine (S)-S-oxide reductase
MNTETILLGMGCFWSPEALFGHLPGVLRTRVGFAGGVHPSPTYRKLGDHTETVEIQYDPEIVPLESILTVFWSSHRPANINEYKGAQYKSLVLYRDESQHQVIQEMMKKLESSATGRPDTEVAPYTGFYPAEERHQKYYLKRYPHALEQLLTLYPQHDELVCSTLAARLNGIAKGFTNLSTVIEEIRTWDMASEEQMRLIHLIQRIKW